MAQTSPDPSDVRKEEGYPDQGWQGHPVVVVSATIGRGRHFPETRAVGLALHEDWLAASTAPLQYPLVRSVPSSLYPAACEQPHVEFRSYRGNVTGKLLCQTKFAIDLAAADNADDTTLLTLAPIAAAWLKDRRDK